LPPTGAGNREVSDLDLARWILSVLESASMQQEEADKAATAAAAKEAKSKKGRCPTSGNRSRAPAPSIMLTNHGLAGRALRAKGFFRMSF
jgi:hypothetical protein